MNPRRLASDTSFSMTSGYADTLAMTGPGGARLVGLGTGKCNEPHCHSEPEVRNPQGPGRGLSGPSVRTMRIPRSARNDLATYESRSRLIRAGGGAGRPST